MHSPWQEFTEMLREQFPAAVPLMKFISKEALAFLNFHKEHSLEVCSTNTLKLIKKD